MPESPYRNAPSAPPTCRNCGVPLAVYREEEGQGEWLCNTCFSERCDFPVLLAMGSLCAGASTGSLVFLVGGLAISGLAAYVIRRWI